MVLLKHTDAVWKDDLSDLPEACRNEKPPLRSPEEVVERIAEIPTRFWRSSECDRQLLVTAAGKVVAQSSRTSWSCWRNAAPRNMGPWPAATTRVSHASARGSPAARVPTAT